jgi:hypothetical protein
MRSALYYPHTQMRNESFLKNSLLLWDEVEFIAPTKHFKFDPMLPPHVTEALELLCRPHVPTATEKQTAHKRIVGLLEHGIPEWLITTELPNAIHYGRPVREFYGADYGIYPEKLDEKTWELLEAAGLVNLSGADYDYYTRPLVGLYLMSLLANVCAGKTSEQITDRADAYSFLWRLAAAEGGAREIFPQDAQSKVPLDRLITLSLKALNTDGIAFEKILALRKREAGRQGHDYRAFRRKYGEKLKECADAIATTAKTQDDRKRIEEEFQLDMKDDLASLKDELQIAKRELVFSKSMLTTVVAGAALFIEPISTSVLLASGAKAIAGGAFMTDLMKFCGSYSKALKGHSSSWLYLAEAPSTRDLPIRDFASRNQRT